MIQPKRVLNGMGNGFIHKDGEIIGKGEVLNAELM